LPWIGRETLGGEFIPAATYWTETEFLRDGGRETRDILAGMQALQYAVIHMDLRNAVQAGKQTMASAPWPEPRRGANGIGNTGIMKPNNHGIHGADVVE
jgi:hypothetical protein